jgi:hypothetical protein
VIHLLIAKPEYPNPDKPELRDCELRNLGISGKVFIFDSPIPEFLNP